MMKENNMKKFLLVLYFIICVGCTPTFIVRDKITDHIPDMEYELVKETDEYIIGRVRYSYYPDSFTSYNKKDYEIIYLK